MITAFPKVYSKLQRARLCWRQPSCACRQESLSLHVLAWLYTLCCCPLPVCMLYSLWGTGLLWCTSNTSLTQFPCRTSLSEPAPYTFLSRIIKTKFVKELRDLHYNYMSGKALGKYITMQINMIGTSRGIPDYRSHTQNTSLQKKNH